MHPEQLLTCALDIGEQMLLSGAEIGRVEDSIRLICNAYGCSRTDVFRNGAFIPNPGASPAAKQT